LSDETLNPHSIAAQVLARFSEVASTRGLALHLTEEDHVPQRILGDAQRITVVLGNLLSNAVKCTDQGKVQLNLARQRGMLLIRVGDTGIGMSQEQHAGLFKAFVQADESDSRRHGGAGLGLTVTRQLLELMGATLAVHSNPG